MRLNFGMDFELGPVQPCIYFGSSYLRFGDVIVKAPKPNYFERTDSALNMDGCTAVPIPGLKEWNKANYIVNQNHSELSKKNDSLYRGGRWKASEQ